MGPIRKPAMIEQGAFGEKSAKFVGETSVQLATAKEPEGGASGNGTTVTSLPLAEVTAEQAMLRLAIDKGAPIETIERLVALTEKVAARKAEKEFNEALSRIQSKIKRVAPDLDNPQTHSKYASYAAIDRIIRPIYSEEGFSLSFTEEDCPKAEHVRIVCFVSKGAYTRQYRKDMPADGKGAKGGDVMTKTHAAAAADSYAKRYLVKDIFNVAIGEDDTDGNTVGSLDDAEVEKNWQHILDSQDLAELRTRWSTHMQEAREANDTDAQKRYIAAKDARKKELENAPY